MGVVLWWLNTDVVCLGCPVVLVYSGLRRDMDIRDRYIGFEIVRLLRVVKCV